MPRQGQTPHRGPRRSPNRRQSLSFREAATAQAKTLGLPSVQRVFVPHPIQDANDLEMAEKADAVIEQVIAALVD